MKTHNLLEKLRRQPENSRYRDLILAVERCGFVHVREEAATNVMLILNIPTPA